ncbi:1,4-dihydroxy-2-naphthoate polyprenyltransferase [Metabacillus idriensis]|uniref:1,4-dihydroxy-2-naphthoate octaprenyltransferase n=1 Tax=Metabacillus idriensis TaxID=324768 RepID=A0A6I2MFI0_9BACI|nr:1,4-dihydroxy-2-naphthoate polyprenyltransferase [Metabacillus idriensis]MCM3596705.1 1,4-dihydroxy-2-naphthoate polyprenyltransferase [Metabacillus idriensis]MDR0137895.1 1,4-dihydroxy-2-naphthoate polyprenyltransferase [Metabacillus idriensis]MRX55211.1 1,4-dihydroxy-2-naphthoate polyprenyltransferase [Metabacillus idriensis]OHR73355.1 1,4-dihydroxy-2-naphthoate octaprenyltransferase [Bacillus sp. HMSC76G11]
MHTQSHTTQNVPSIKPDKSWKVWWMLLRPHTLSAAFIPVTIGTVLALNEGQVHILLFLAMLIASILIQAATNMFNEYFDFKRGLDNENSVGIGGAIVRNGVKPKTVLNLAFAFFAVAALLGVYICMTSTWWIAVIGLICMATGYFYTGGPMPIAYTPFGELVAGFFMGMVIILLAYYIQTGTISPISIIISIPIAFLVGNIMLSNNIRDLDGDKENGRKTLAILIGRKKAIIFLASMFAASYAVILIMIALGHLSFWALLVLISTPKAYSAVKKFVGKSLPLEMMPAMKATAQTNIQFGFLLALGLFISTI